MSDPYVILGIPEDADDEAIRARYLELTRQFTPEHHPDKFAAIRNAYEKLKDLDTRVQYRLYQVGKDETVEAILQEVICRNPRPRIGLPSLIKMALPSRND